MEFTIVLRESATDRNGEEVDGILCTSYHVSNHGVFFKHSDEGAEGFVPHKNIKLIITKKQ